jgi:hypothetical protein
VIEATYPELRSEREKTTQLALAALFADQQFDVLVAGRRLGKRWDARLARELYAANMLTATLYGDRVADTIGTTWEPALMAAWLTVNSELGAQAINDSTRVALAGAADDAAAVQVFEQLERASEGYARAAVTSASTLGSHDAAAVGGCSQKTWLAAASSQRHSKLSGVSVPIDGRFSNGMRGPGDPAGGAAEVANCSCSLGYS